MSANTHLRESPSAHSWSVQKTLVELGDKIKLGWCQPLSGNGSGFKMLWIVERLPTSQWSSISVAGVHHGVNLRASFQTSLNCNIGVNKAGQCLLNTSPIKQSNDEQFRATGTSQYPAAMDRALVVAFLETLVTAPTTCP